MFYQLKDKYRRWRFHIACKSILESHPASTHQGGEVVLFTQLQHKDVLLALLAFKSFASYVPIKSFHILNDGSLTSRDISLLEEHFPGVIFHSVDAVKSDKCPTGGCWERLLTIADLVKDNYVIQLDSDTLTLGNLPEIIKCTNSNTSFVIGTWDKQDFESMAVRQNHARRIVEASTTRSHIQVAAEASFNKLDGFDELRYVRGCAGFMGFGRGSFGREFVEDISGQMLAALGERWKEWGSEQVMSNIVVANTARSMVLPHPKYCDCTKIKDGESIFIHFIGSCRFTGPGYAKLAREVIDALRQ